MCKPTHQLKAGVHGQKDEGGFCLSAFIQFSGNAVKVKAAHSAAGSPLNGVTLVGILIHLSFDACISIGGFSAARRQAGQADTALETKQLAAPGLIDSVRQHYTGIAAKFAFVGLHSGFEVRNYSSDRTSARCSAATHRSLCGILSGFIFCFWPTLVGLPGRFR